VAFHSPLAVMLSVNSFVGTILTWLSELIKLLKMGMNFSLAENW
jgi:hypothetical protein